MEYYKEEGEIIPDCVINYYIVAGNDQLVSFSVLPLLWSADETPGNSDTQIFLCGTAVTGQKMYEKVIAWRPEISYALPMIYVLSKDKVWMQLQKPRRSFKDSIMSTLITVHCLHFLKWNLKADISALWTQLHKAFSTYEVAPSKSHLLCHLPLIEEAAKRDKDLAKSELLPTLLLETPTCEVNRATKKLNFEVGSQVDYEENDSDDDDETYDSVCVLCDNGGELLCCEDKCLRSFHPNINAGVDSSCESLGYSDAQVEAIQTFFCNNCQYQQHQCFVCGKLGSSDQSSVPEVFQCANADCGHFYHPNCVAELLQPCDTFKTKELQLKIHSGESFVCPAHKCNICMKGEDKTVHELQFAMCRRCPKAYHRKCLPSEITFQCDGNIDQRAWDGLLSNRILIYCMDHEILSEIGTPKRDHIIFPNVEGKMQTTWGLLSSKEKLIKSRDMGSFTMRNPLKQRLNHAGIYCGHSTSATYTKERSHAQGKEIIDNDILNWANDKVESSGKKTRIESFRDKTLSNGIFFLELLSAVEARVVNWDLVTNGENDEEKKSNATYIISVAWKLGCSIFLLPEDIMEVNSKMILYLTASIMYWSLNQKGGGHKLHPSGRSSDASPAESEDEAEDVRQKMCQLTLHQLHQKM